MKFKFLLLAAFAAIAFSGQVQARTAPLANPQPISIPAGLTDKEVVKEIKRALLQRTWEIESESPGVVNAVLHLREHVAKIRVNYDGGQVRIAYVDSTNLDYKKKPDGTEYIHPNYLGWMQFLASDIKVNLGVATLDKQ